jgi:hypothetical protein
MPGAKNNATHQRYRIVLAIAMRSFAGRFMARGDEW